MKEDQKLITIARFGNGFEAEQSKMVLDEAGIHSVLFGESLGGALPNISKMDYIELQVFQGDQARAAELLKEIENGDEYEQDEPL